MVMKLRWKSPTPLTKNYLYFMQSTNICALRLFFQYVSSLKFDTTTQMTQEALIYASRQCHAS